MGPTEPPIEDPPVDASPSLLGTESDHEMRRAARIAGLRDFETPSLEQVERRRFELLGLTCGFLVVLATAMALLPSIIDFAQISTFFETFGGTVTVVRVLLVLLAVVFGFYVFEKERYLRSVSSSLVNERVLSAALSNRLKEVSSLTEAGRAVLSVLDLGEVLHVILRAAFELLEADEGSVLLVEGDELHVDAAVGHAEPYIGTRQSITEGFAGYVARTRESILLQGKLDLEDFEHPPGPLDRNILSSMSVPLEAKGELLGILNLNVTTSERRYNEYDLRALGLFGEHAAMAIRHARVLGKERNLRTQVVELDRLRTELLGSMTHDLKTPLTSIFGSARILRDRFDEVERSTREELLDSIARQSERLLELIKRLLDAARSQSSYPLRPGRIDLCAQVDALVKSYESANDRRMDVQFDAPRIEAFADPDAVEQIVANLLENAVKYTPPDTSISVEAGSENTTAFIRVSDQGPGIPVEEQEHIFEPFKRSTAGHGLGLFIVSNLVRSMGGNVSLDSTPGRGTAFTVRLPKEPPSETSDATAFESVAAADEQRPASGGTA